MAFIVSISILLAGTQAHGHTSRGAREYGLMVCPGIRRNEVADQLAVSATWNLNALMLVGLCFCLWWIYVLS